MSTEIEQANSDSSTGVLAVVGIGASAGGLKSIEAMFAKMPVDTGLAFVVIQHLSPEHKSLMKEILSRRTSMPVILAAEELTMEPNHVYVIPPGKELRCVGVTLVITDMPSGLHRPIDTFFHSLAANAGVSTIGVILSGTGSDGSAGLSAIHRTGGLTIAESLETAEFDGMPISAERTGAVDLVLRPDEMPDAMCSYLANSSSTEGMIEETSLSGVRLIFSLLEKRYGLRFEQYKPRTIARRIDRRQAMGRFRSVSEYAEHLDSDVQELDDLFHDLLIGVTKFFRDDQAFRALEEKIEADLAELPDDETYRVWVMGCATGEEPYSIAMIALDAIERLGRQPLLKIFATDIHQRSLDLAAQGEFNAEALEFVSLDRQRKYFDRRDDGVFRVNPNLRRHLVFANHNAIQDPPFTNIHLATCRNVLIYFRGVAQHSALASLHFSLVPKGMLFLGPSESLGDLSSEFEALDAKWRIFRKIRDRRDLVTHVKRVRDVPAAARTGPRLLNADQPSAMSVHALLEVYDALIESRVTLGVLLDQKQNLIHAIGDVARILKATSGRFHGTLSDFLDPPARTTVTAALIRSQKGCWYDVSGGASAGRISTAPKCTMSALWLCGIQSMQTLVGSSSLNCVSKSLNRPSAWCNPMTTRTNCWNPNCNSPEKV